MADNNKDEATAQNRISTAISSSDSATDTLLRADSNETSASELPPRSGYRPISIISSQSNLPSSLSGGTISELTTDDSTPVNTSQSRSVGSEYNKGRFACKPTSQGVESSELEQPTVSSCSSSNVVTPIQESRSVTFNDPPTDPSSVKSPEKGATGMAASLVSWLTRSQESQDSPDSQDSYEIKECIDLPMRNLPSRSPPRNNQFEESVIREDISRDRPNDPLLSSNQTNRPQSLTRTEIQRPVGERSRPNQPVSPVSTNSSLRPCDNTLIWGSVVVVVVIISAILTIACVIYVYYVHADNITDTAANRITTTPFPLDVLSLHENGEGSYTTDTDAEALPYVTGADNMEGETAAFHSDNPTATSIANILTSEFVSTTKIPSIIETTTTTDDQD